MPISIKLTRGERGGLVGQTGTGKTLLAECNLLPRRGRLAAIDPKRELNFDAPIFEDVGEIIRRRPERYIYRPSPGNIRNYAAYERLYRNIFERGDCFLYTDEIVVTLRGMEPPEAFLDIYALGRSRGITCLTATQRPARIPLFLLSECRRIYAFRVVLPADKKRMREIIPGYTGQRPPLEEIERFRARYGYTPKVQFAFTYFNTETEETRLGILEDPKKCLSRHREIRSA
jgi:hypothetical protein